MWYNNDVHLYHSYTTPFWEEDCRCLAAFFFCVWYNIYVTFAVKTFFNFSLKYL